MASPPLRSRFHHRIVPQEGGLAVHNEAPEIFGTLHGAGAGEAGTNPNYIKFFHTIIPNLTVPPVIQLLWRADEE